jgi:hypothetical protein
MRDFSAAAERLMSVGPADDHNEEQLNLFHEEAQQAVVAPLVDEGKRELLLPHAACLLHMTDVTRLPDAS